MNLGIDYHVGMRKPHNLNAASAPFNENDDHDAAAVQRGWSPVVCCL